VRTLKLVVAYEGTRYVGWQRQAAGLSIQGLLEDALVPLNGGEPVTVVGAGRTDAGVHARGQTASCRLRSTLEPADLRRAINARLPEDVRVVDVSDAPDGFHARYAAIRKTYRYCVLNAEVSDPLSHRFVWHVKQRLDLDIMRSAMRAVIGTHDFNAFMASGSPVTTTVRTLFRADVAAQPWGRRPGSDREPAVFLTFVFTGDGFLRHMVRNLVGTLVETGSGKRDAADWVGLVTGGDRRQAGATAPAQGLMLHSVEYAADLSPASVDETAATSPGERLSLPSVITMEPS
jgi:tRNA pseudouridine38-40 synthase